ncbi:hypothetical protein [Hansschlegelia zhihuaiae]|uniref:DUF4410 domain-containing protein n=1 Tax=Hansschlegelia zhihuaiae TaxID=405005 RepID=A0A4Q0MMH6_9HYPH|nr:hypothetical protein [Hansschlegelia zhihuaiae]RXF74938.1 hypothetical protein EK403_02435 [Hansschlegelia zhihuaiae]
MRLTLLKFSVAAALALALSACAAHPPFIPAEQPSYVGKVEVRTDPKITSTRIAQAVRSETMRESTRYGRSGAAKELRISIERLNYKNPVASLLIGDANHVKARVAVIDAASGRPHGEFEADAIDNLAINGVVGAVMAATQDKGAVDERLAEKLASVVMERVYGTAAATEARKREPVDVAEEAPALTPPAPAPAAKPKPGAPKRAPVAKQPAAPAAAGKTAMATGPAPVPAVR